MSLDDMARQLISMETNMRGRLELAEREIMNLRTQLEAGQQGGKGKGEGKGDYDDRRFVKSGLKDFTKIYPEKFTKSEGWKVFEDEVLRWIGVEDEVLQATLKSVTAQAAPVTHQHGRDAVFLYAHLRGWVLESEARQIIKTVKTSDGVEAWRQLARRFDPQTALTKAARLDSITGFAKKNSAKTNKELPIIISKFENRLDSYEEDFKTVALTDDLKMNTLMSILPPGLSNMVKDLIVMHSKTEDTLDYGELKAIVMGRVTRDVNEQSVPMDVDGVDEQQGAIWKPESYSQKVNWADDWAEDPVASVGKQPMQGGIGKGAPAGKGWQSGAGPFMPKGACANCWKQGHWKNECTAPPWSPGGKG